MITVSEFNEKDNIENGVEKDNDEFERNTQEIKNETSVKAPKTVTRQTFIVSAVAIFLVAVMLTYTICTAVYKGMIDDAHLSNVSMGEDDDYGKLDIIRGLFEKYSYLDVDDGALLDTVIRAYVAETGDRYAVYYNAEEYAEHLISVSGKTVGVGVTVTKGEIVVDEIKYSVLQIIDVTKDGPADKAGVKIGDVIAWIGETDSEKLVGDMEYESAVAAIKGEAGTFAEFSVFRKNTESYEKLHFSIERKSIDSPTVYYSVSESDRNVGIVRITNFKYNTPKQFTDAVDALLEKGCENFVFDVRGNPGGSLDSVVAVLSYLVREGDLIVSTLDTEGVYKEIRAGAITGLEGELVYCNVAAEDVGKYREKISKMAVLCNGSSASAAELFTAAFRDHSIGAVVGKKTYGKGTVQTVFSLAQFGYSGGLRLTTMKYFPPSAESYDGIGIYPTENYEIELSEEALRYTLNTLPEELDDQLKGAIRSFE